MPRKANVTVATPTPGETDSSPGLTDNEMRFIKAVFDNMTQRPDANWESVAADLGLKDAKCAKERFRQMSVRHGWREQAGGGASPRKGGATGASGEGRVKKVPRTPTKKTAKSAAAVEKSDEEEDQAAAE
ncbi:hypothetical protein UVI_02001100 [Ustilaginoidea virens]|uniref:Myb-like domain-containing protein n=1 Tax=Ustilaginoidea virens TaxID=1159556 RepID=A0A063CD53_USTVR|nr:hypothetical protein UVI_02001100 [Ustilaginoidea virens]